MRKMIKAVLIIAIAGFVIISAFYNVSKRTIEDVISNTPPSMPPVIVSEKS